jgi:outer membrane protease
MKDIEDLKNEAEALGVTYSANIGAAKLQAKIDAFYDAESAGHKVNEVEVEIEVAPVVKEDIKAVNKQSAIAIIKEQERINLESVVVKLTMVDRREASTATDAYFSNGDVAMNIPLDTWVEVPRLIAMIADEARAITHMETDSGSVPKAVKKYVIEYK